MARKTVTLLGSMYLDCIKPFLIGIGSLSDRLFPDEAIVSKILTSDLQYPNYLGVGHQYVPVKALNSHDTTRHYWGHWGYDSAQDYFAILKMPINIDIAEGGLLLRSLRASEQDDGDDGLRISYEVKVGHQYVPVKALNTLIGGHDATRHCWGQYWGYDSAGQDCFAILKMPINIDIAEGELFLRSLCASEQDYDDGLWISYEFKDHFSKLVRLFLTDPSSIPIPLYARNFVDGYNYLGSGRQTRMPFCDHFSKLVRLCLTDPSYMVSSIPIPLYARNFVDGAMATYPGYNYLDSGRQTRMPFCATVNLPKVLCNTNRVVRGLKTGNHRCFSTYLSPNDRKLLDAFEVEHHREYLSRIDCYIPSFVMADQFDPRARYMSRLEYMRWVSRAKSEYHKSCIDERLQGDQLFVVGTNTDLLEGDVTPLQYFPIWKGLIRANIDGSYDYESRRGGMGVVFQNHLGAVIDYISEPIECDVESAEEAELYALEKAVSIAQAKDYKNFSVQSDCGNIVDIMRGKKVPEERFEERYKKLDQDFQGFSFGRIYFVHRELNRAADYAAKMALKDADCCWWVLQLIAFQDSWEKRYRINQKKLKKTTVEVNIMVPDDGRRSWY